MKLCLHCCFLQAQTYSGWILWNGLLRGLHRLSRPRGLWTQSSDFTITDSFPHSGVTQNPAAIIFYMTHIKWDAKVPDCRHHVIKQGEMETKFWRETSWRGVEVQTPVWSAPLSVAVWSQQTEQLLLWSVWDAMTGKCPQCTRIVGDVGFYINSTWHYNAQLSWLLNPWWLQTFCLLATPLSTQRMFGPFHCPTWY